MTCQLDSKTKQLAVVPSGFYVLHCPSLVLVMAFLPGCCPSAGLVYGGRSLLQTPLNGSVTRLEQGLVSQCRPRHFCYVDQGDSPFVTLVTCGKYCLYHPDYLFIFTVLRFCGGPSAGVGLINALWGAGRLFTCRRAARCNEPFRIPLYKQLRDCRSLSLYWVSYL